jgi:hypothetical protein
MTRMAEHFDEVISDREKFRRSMMLLGLVGMAMNLATVVAVIVTNT